jgi:hypothetical protein
MLLRNALFARVEKGLHTCSLGMYSICKGLERVTYMLSRNELSLQGLRKGYIHALKEGTLFARVNKGLHTCSPVMSKVKG